MRPYDKKRKDKSHKTPAQRRAETARRKKDPKAKEDAVKRAQARQAMIKSGKAKVGDGKDVHHKKPLSKGGGNSKRNLAMTSPRNNRGHGMSGGNKRKRKA